MFPMSNSPTMPHKRKTAPTANSGVVYFPVMLILPSATFRTKNRTRNDRELVERVVRVIKWLAWKAGAGRRKCEAGLSEGDRFTATTHGGIPLVQRGYYSRPVPFLCWRTLQYAARLRLGQSSRAMYDFRGATGHADGAGTQVVTWHRPISARGVTLFSRPRRSGSSRRRGR